MPTYTTTITDADCCCGGGGVCDPELITLYEGSVTIYASVGCAVGYEACSTTCAPCFEPEDWVMDADAVTVGDASWTVSDISTPSGGPGSGCGVLAGLSCANGLWTISYSTFSATEGEVPTNGGTFVTTVISESYSPFLLVIEMSAYLFSCGDPSGAGEYKIVLTFSE